MFRRNEIGSRWRYINDAGELEPMNTHFKWQIASAIAITLCLATSRLDAGILADSLDDWSVTGTQGENNWENGWRNFTADGGGAYDASNFIPFLNDGTNGATPTSQAGPNHWNWHRLGFCSYGRAVDNTWPGERASQWNKQRTERRALG